ncbi:MAG: TonB-dependent receptor, partial [Hymenobacter sp.]
GFFDNVLRLTVAARYSANNNVTARVKQNVVTPRFGLSATVLPGTAVYAVYDQSYIAQTAFDINNDLLPAQRGKNIEAGIKREWLDGRFSTTVAAFNINKTNIAQSLQPINPQFPNAQVAIGEVRSRGIEADFTGELVSGLNLVANYSLLDATITKDNNEANIGRRLGGTAKHNSNAWLNYRFQRGALKGFGLSGGMQWQVERYAGLGNQGVKLPDNYYRLDAGVSWQGDHLGVNLLVNNITNRYNYAAGAFTAASGSGATAIGSYYTWQPEAPTSFRLTAGYSF